MLAANRCKTKENAELVSFILPLREGRARPRARPGPAPLAWVPGAQLGAGRVAGTSPGLLARDELRAHGHLEHLLLSIASRPRQLGHGAATAQHQDPLSPAAVSTPGRRERLPGAAARTDVCAHAPGTLSPSSPQAFRPSSELGAPNRSSPRGLWGHTRVLPTRSGGIWAFPSDLAPPRHRRHSPQAAARPPLSVPNS